MTPLARPRAAFILFETMLAVMIFSIAVIALGKCVDNCLRAEIAIQEEDRARRALENRMAEVESGAEKVTDPKTVELKGPFAGMKLKQSREPLKWKNEKNEEVSGLYEITLLLTWENRGETHERTLNFYVWPKQ